MIDIVFKNGKGLKSDLKISFQMFEVWEILYLVKIFWKVNNLENYLEFGDVEHAY